MEELGDLAGSVVFSLDQNVVMKQWQLMPPFSSSLPKIENIAF